MSPCADSDGDKNIWNSADGKQGSWQPRQRQAQTHSGRSGGMSRPLAVARPWLSGARSTLANRLAGHDAVTTPPGVVGIPSSARRPIGGFRGALTGFALGLAATSAFGFVYLLREYRIASEAMAVSVQELESSTQKVTEAYARVTALEERLGSLEQSAGTKDELRRRNADLVRVYDALHEDVYEVRRKLFDIEQDTNRLLRVPLSRQANGRMV